jgi:hypothetical protein
LATPKAKEDYNEDGEINDLDDPFVEPGDDFGFNQSWEYLPDSKTYSPTKQTDI